MRSSLRCGLLSRSTPKLMKVIAVIRIASTRPGTKTHSHRPWAIAPCGVGLVEHRAPRDRSGCRRGRATARPASAPIAPVAAPTKAAATSEVMLGMISRKTIRNVPSPENFAAVTKSRLRRVMICARLARAAPAQRGDRDDADDQPDAAHLGVGDQRDDQRQRRDDQRDVGDEGEDVVDDGALGVAGDHADDQGDHRGQQAAEEPDQQRDPGAVDQLGGDVLAVGRRAEPVGRARAGQRRERAVEWVVRRDQRREDRRRARRSRG